MIIPMNKSYLEIEKEIMFNTLIKHYEATNELSLICNRTCYHYHIDALKDIIDFCTEYPVYINKIPYNIHQQIKIIVVSMIVLLIKCMTMITILNNS
jgi:hypothetical protein